MAPRGITAEQYEKLVDAYRQRPGSPMACATVAGIDYRTAKKGWEEGWPGVKGRERPISEIVAEEQAHARARLQDLQQQVDEALAHAETKRRQDEADKARTDVTQARTEEAQMIRMARGAATGLLITLTHVSKGVTKVGGKVAKALETLAEAPGPLSPTEMVNLTKLVGNLTTALRQANDAGARAMEMERLLLGEPTQIIGVAHLQEVTMEEAERRIAAAQRALERAKGKGSFAAGAVVDAEVVQASAPVGKVG